MILGVSFDTPEDQKAFADAQGFPYKLLSDPDKSVGTAYHAVRDPSEKFADFSQRYTYLIRPGGEIAKNYSFGRDADLKAHADEVLADINAMT